MLRTRILKLSTLLAAVYAAGLSAGSASATLALNQSAAFAVVPILPAGTIQWSYATFTNTSDQNVTLHLNFIDSRDWSALDYSCPVTGQETVLFVFRSTATGSAVDFKCSLAVVTANGVQVVSTPTTLNLPLFQGLMTVAVESPAGTTVSSNILVGDWLVVNFPGGGCRWNRRDHLPGALGPRPGRGSQLPVRRQGVRDVPGPGDVELHRADCQFLDHGPSHPVHAGWDHRRPARGSGRPGEPGPAPGQRVQRPGGVAVVQLCL